MNGDHDLALEALSFLKDWSSGLVIVESGIISVTGAMLKGTRRGPARSAALVSFLAFIISIVAAANVLGSLPGIAEDLGGHVGQSIYDQPANLLFTLRTNCTVEAVLFLAGLASFMVFAWLRTENTGMIETRK
jgi:hypothetical protein